MKKTIDDFVLENLAVSMDDDGITTVTLNRPNKRNALNADTVEELIEVFSALPRMGARAVVLRAEGTHFCAGLDLVEHHDEDRRPEDFMHLCLRWHEACNKREYGGVPIIAALKGAVVGGGLELASSAHIRVADASTYFALPEGQRGLFTGGGATIRVADLVGKARQAFANGWLGVETFGRVTFVAVTRVEPAELETMTRQLAKHFVAVYGAPSDEAALPVAQEELRQMAEICADHAPNTVLTVARELTGAGGREQYRFIEASEAGLDQFAIHGSLDD